MILADIADEAGESLAATCLRGEHIEDVCEFPDQAYSALTSSRVGGDGYGFAHEYGMPDGCGGGAGSENVQYICVAGDGHGYGEPSLADGNGWGDSMDGNGDGDGACRKNQQL